MKPSTLQLDPRFEVDEVSPLIFGGFLEHLGRAVYQGVYDPESVHADEDGLRRDVLEALRELEMTVMRYPGGNFASGYHWRDGVGPKSERPTVRELAWQSIEPNQLGTDEFIRLCAKLDWQPMLAVNLGTGTPEEARDWVEYCNSPSGTRVADLRARNGAEAPHGVPLWCLGNEMDGPWQIGHVPAEQYAIRAQQAAKLMRDVDPSIRLVACGSSGPAMPTFLEWDRTVLERLGGLAHYVSLHRYVGPRDGPPEDYLAVGRSVDRQIEAVDACARYVQARSGSRRRTYLCFDEWNVWYRTRSPEGMDGRGQLAPPLLEEVYDIEDALVVASFLLSFIRHADVVKIANLAQIVNVIAPILTRGDQLLRQSIWYAFRMISRRKRGVALRPIVDGPGRVSPRYGETPWLDAAAIHDPGARRLSVFAINRHADEPMPLAIRLADGKLVLEDAEILTGAPGARNDWDDPEQVVSRPFDEIRCDAEATTLLPPLSLVAATFAIA